MSDHNPRSRVGQTTNTSSVTDDNPAASNGHYDRPELSTDAFEELREKVLLFFTVDDRDVAAGALPGIDCRTPAEMTKKTTKGKIIIIAAPDDVADDAVRTVAHKCRSLGAQGVFLWRIEELGSRYGKLKEWSEHFNLALVIEHSYIYEGKNLEPITEGVTGPTFSEEPRKLKQRLLPVPPLERNMLPESLRDWIVDIGDRACAPPDVPAAAVIVELGALIGARLAIRPKRNNHGWLVVPNLWGAVVGRPSMLKSPLVREAMEPLWNLQRKAQDCHREDMKDWDEKKLIAEARRAAAKKKLNARAEGGKKGVPASDDELAKLAHDALAGSDGVGPRERRYIVNDCTVEKLQMHMAENPNGLLYLRDELTGLLKTMDKPGHEGDRPFFLESWEGLQPYVVDRMGRPKLFVERCCLGVFGTIQPGPIFAYLRPSISGASDDGFAPRVQVLVWPDAYPNFVYKDLPPNQAARDRAFAVFQAIAEMDPIALGLGSDVGPKIPYIGFSDAAQEFFISWFTDLENRVRGDDLPTMLDSLLGKYRSFMPSLALLFHVVDSVEPVDSNWKEGKITKLDPVSVQAAASAARWCTYFEAHAMRLFEAAEDPDPKEAAGLLRKMGEELPDPFSLRDLQRKSWKGMAKKEDAERVLGMLEAHGWVKSVTVENPVVGTPGQQFWMHPSIKKKAGEPALASDHPE
jgi:Protein of unknown function (DUF3987)